MESGVMTLRNDNEFQDALAGLEEGCLYSGLKKHFETV